MQTVTAPRAPISRYFALSAYWFGFSFHWFLLLPILMPADVRGFVGEASAGAYYGGLASIAVLIPLLLPPFLGAWSDRVGKRMVFMTWGTLINLIGLGLMLIAPNFWWYALAFGVVQLGNAIASTPYQALIPDVVPETERGTSSAALGLFELLGQIVGGVINFAVGGNRSGAYLAVIVALGLSFAVTRFFTREPKVVRSVDHGFPWRVFLTPPYRNFRWVFLTRAFIETGRFAVQPFLSYYLRDVIKVFALGGFVIATAKGEPDAGLAVTFLLIALSVTAAITAVISGTRSDKIGKKPVIYFAGAVMAIAALGFALVHSYVLALLFGLLFGLGYGAYISVDWALATSVLPDPSKNARDMGVWHIALTFPQLFQYAFGAIRDAGTVGGSTWGYLALFGIAVVFFVLGTVFVSRVRGVR
jgi:MFS family permease